MNRLCILILMLYSFYLPYLQAQPCQELIDQASNYYYQQDYYQAYTSFNAALTLEPTNPALHFNAGLMLALANNHESALVVFNAALNLQPDYVKALWYKGRSLATLHNYSDAITSLEHALKVDPANITIQQDFTQTLFKAAHAAHTSGDLATATQYYERILQEHPEQLETLYNLAYTLRLRGDDADACTYYQKALSLNPNHEQAHFGYAKALLALGNFDAGWQEFEWRWHNSNEYIKIFGHHQLTLSMLRDRRVVLRAEWGLGDTIQFIRYALLLKQYGATVIAQVDSPLIPLFSRCSYIDQLCAVGEPLPTHDYQIPLLSMPLVASKTNEPLPAKIPYLYSDPRLVEFWKPHVNKTTYNIGICWQSKPDIFLEEQPTTKRSLSLSFFYPLASLPGVQLYSLQHHHGTEQLAHLPDDIRIIAFEGLDTVNGRYMDTAAIMQHLDLIITVDTSIVHLAGALGRPVWVLLPHVAEWRWMHNRSDTPWYPTMQLFRQPVSGDWNSVQKTIVQKINNQIR